MNDPARDYPPLPDGVELEHIVRVIDATDDDSTPLSHHTNSASAFAADSGEDVDARALVASASGVLVSMNQIANANTGFETPSDFIRAVIDDFNTRRNVALLDSHGADFGDLNTDGGETDD